MQSDSENDADADVQVAKPAVDYLISSGTNIGEKDGADSSDSESGPLSAVLDHCWQAAGTSVRDRNRHMFNNDLISDVSFLVGLRKCRQRIPAHKYVLATGSSVFFAMFYGELKDPSSEIEIPDVEPQAFLILLKYLYCDEVDIDGDSVLTTLYAAKKYIVPHLAEACVQFLESSLNAHNACVLLGQSQLFEESNLTQRCWEVIDAQAEEALASEGLTEVDPATLELVLSRETLNAKESLVFAAASRWAEAECRRQGLEPSPTQARQVLGRLLYLVRVPAMQLEEFANGAAQSGLLTLQETHDVFLHFTARQTPALPFPTRKRAGMRAKRVRRFQSSAFRNNQWRYRGRIDSIGFSVDRRVFVAGFGLYGSSLGSADYAVRIELKRGGGVVVGRRLTKLFTDGSSDTFPVLFQNPLQVEAEVVYTASIQLSGQELSYFGQEGLSEVTSEGVTFQFQCSPESTNGTGIHGGQIPEIIFYS